MNALPNMAVDKQSPQVTDVLVVGAGFAGLYLLHRLREAGFTALAIEAGDDVGGTWYWNRYPGARCDVESIDYQLAFPSFLQREWTWTERYAAQPEIEAYLRFVAERLDLRRDVRFGETVVSAEFDDLRSRWSVRTDNGQLFDCAFFVLATGCLSAAQQPDIEGCSAFGGQTFHTGAWPSPSPDFKGKKVAVIGTGSSGVQLIPEIADQADHLYVLQRTANFVFPAFNRDLIEGEAEAGKEEFSQRRAIAMESSSFSTTVMESRSALEVGEQEREAQFEDRWLRGGGFGFLAAFSDILVNPNANALAADFVRRKIRSMVGNNPDLVKVLVPEGFPLGTKRIALGTDYYETFGKSNVSLLDIRKNAIRRVDNDGIQLDDGRIDVDVIVFATGFDAMTGAISKIHIEANGVTLQKRWEDGARTYMGVSVAGFPNMFLVTGPGSPSVLTNVVVSIEYDVDWIMRCLEFLRNKGFKTIEATEEAEREWTDHVQTVSQGTLYPLANSWYLGANVPGKPRLFLPYVGGASAFRAKREAVAEAGFVGFSLEKGVDPVVGAPHCLPR